HVPNKCRRIVQECLPQLDRSIDLGAIPQFGGRIDRSSAVASLFGSPRCVSVEIFERETDIVHEFVAAGARLIFAVKGHLLTQGEDFARPTRRVLQWWDVWRRLRSRGAEDVFQDPDASLDR